MRDNFRFMRDIWIFGEEDRGFGFEGSPRGYLKIEVRQGKGKIQALVLNLIELKSGQSYDLYLLKIKDKENQNIKIGSITVNKGRGELTWEFDPFNVGDSNSIISDFNVGVLVVRSEEKTMGTNLQCPLVAYKKEKVRWREVLDSIVVNSRNAASDASVNKEINLESNTVVNKSSDTDIDAGTNISIDNVEIIRDEDNSQNKIFANSERPKADENLPIDDAYNKYTGKPETRYSFYSEDLLPGAVLVPPSDTVGEVNEVTDKVKDEEISEDADDKKITSYDIDEIVADRKVEDNNEKLGDQVQESIYDEQYIREVLYQDDRENTKESEVRETDNNQNDIIKPDSYSSRKRTPDISRLVRLLDREFKRCDPFNSRRRDYRWWSINSPVNLVNILEECRINVPSFFNPSVVMAYFKYRYLIAGIYTSRRRGREYFVCGIPGTYSIDESPFGDMCRWVQVERRNRAYGAFGYWVVYVDPDTGELLRFR